MDGGYRECGTFIPSYTIEKKSPRRTSPRLMRRRDDIVSATYTEPSDGSTGPT